MDVGAFYRELRAALPGDKLHPVFDLLADHLAKHWPRIDAGDFDAVDVRDLVGPLSRALADRGFDLDPMELRATAMKCSRAAAWLRSFPTEEWSEDFVRTVRDGGTAVFYFAHLLTVLGASIDPCGVPLDVLAAQAPSMTRAFVEAFEHGGTLRPEEVHFYRRLHAAGRLAPPLVEALRRCAPEVLPPRARC